MSTPEQQAYMDDFNEKGEYYSLTVKTHPTISGYVEIYLLEVPVAIHPYGPLITWLMGYQIGRSSAKDLRALVEHYASTDWDPGARPNKTD